MNVLVLFLAVGAAWASEEEELGRFLAEQYEPVATKYCNLVNVALWSYETDVNSEQAQNNYNTATLENARFEKEQWEQHFRGVDWQSFQNETVRRQMEILSVLGVAALDDAKLSQLNNCTTTMSNIYATAKVCPYKEQNCDLASEAMSLDPGLENLMASSRDYDELAYAWEGWRNASGALMRQDYKLYVTLKNEAARLNNMSDLGELWRYEYSSPSLEEDVKRIWEQMEPLYTDLHLYTMNKLKAVYGDKMDISDGLIPAHLLGNMWAQSWGNIFDIVRPYPNATAVDVTSSLIEQGYTAKRMFETSDEFYTSLGLPNNKMSYGDKAMLERPTDGREVICHASAWDFCIKTDFRIKMCTNINMEDFVTVHHEMGHIQYYIQYKDQPIAFRQGANPGFHEAVGDTIALSVSTPKHLKEVNLLDEYIDSDESDINSLMSMALEKVAFLPFGLLIDMWRWDVFSGKVSEDQWNAHWWELRKQYQRVKPPVPRSEKDFDPGAKYHVPADSQYIAYFIAHILQFQFHKALCVAAKQYDPSQPEKQPLHKCDIYRSKEAGSLLEAGLSLGGSRNWKEALKALTGEDEYNAGALLEYFRPLHEFLQKENSQYRSTSGNGEETNNAVPVVVGCVVGGALVVLIIGYLMCRRRHTR